MQFAQVSAAILVALLLPHSGHASIFMASKNTEVAGQMQKHNKEMPVVKHDKTAGDDYNKGSPLYEKQEARKKEGAGKEKPEEPKGAADDEVKVAGAEVPVNGKVAEFWNRYGFGGEPKKHFINGVTFFITHVIFMMLVGLIFIKFSNPRRLEESYPERIKNFKGLSFAYGLFETAHCFDHHCNMCLCSWCCPVIRLADTYSKLPKPAIISGFWTALIFVAVLDGLSPLTYGVTGFAFLCFAVYARQQLRKKYGYERGPKTVFFDCLSWICCPCCSIAQEARQVDFVHPEKMPQPIPEAYK